jgi:predicted GNAT superfamily acetyltransferase
MVEIRTLHAIEDFQKIPAVEMSAWGFSDYEVEPHHLMQRAQKYGGLVQGLFLDGAMIGFTYAIIGKWEGAYFIYSHMAAVMKEYQNQGYGFLLKKAQREGVLKMGYDVIRWNFDPLESLNSFFNIHRLGVVSVEYDKNIYGTGESGLHKGLTGDIAYIETPKRIRSIKERDMKEALAWRMKQREFFGEAFARGFIVEDFVFSEDRDRVFFKLRRGGKRA